MKNILLIAGMLTLSYISHSQHTYRTEIFSNEIKYFMDSVRSQTNGKLNYHVFVVKLFSQHPNSNSLCFSISYIMNYVNLNDQNLNHYIKIDSDYVMINKNDFNSDVFLGRKIKNKDSVCQNFLSNKLLDIKKGYISSHPEGAIVCISQKQIKKKFYEYADDMPPQFSVFNMPEGAIIQKIYEPKVEKK